MLKHKTARDANFIRGCDAVDVEVQEVDEDAFVFSPVEQIMTFSWTRIKAGKIRRCKSTVHWPSTAINESASCVWHTHTRTHILSVILSHCACHMQLGFHRLHEHIIGFHDLLSQLYFHLNVFVIVRQMISVMPIREDFSGFFVLTKLGVRSQFSRRMP